MLVFRRMLLREKQIKTFLKKSLPDPVFEYLKSVRSLLRKMKRSTQKTYTKSDLANDLRRAGIKAGDVVMVHSSLRSIGSVQGGAESVVQSFMDVLTPEGTLIMTAYGTAGKVFDDYKQGKLVDLRTEPSLAGQITEVFRCKPGVYRSSHPFSSITAWGKHAQRVTADHAKESRICHADSPIARLKELGGKIVGLGTTLGYVSFYHIIEDTGVGFPFNPYLPEETVAYIDAQGQRVERPIRRYNPEFSKTRIETEAGRWVREYFGRTFLKNGIMTDFNYGAARSWVLDANLMHQELLNQLAKGITIYTTAEQGEKLV